MPASMRAGFMKGLVFTAMYGWRNTIPCTSPSTVYYRAVVRENKAFIVAQTEVSNQGEKGTGFVLESRITDPDGKQAAFALTGGLSANSLQTSTFSADLSVSNPKLWSLETPNLYILVSLVKEGGKVVDSVTTTFGIRTLAFDKDKGFFP